MHTDYYNEVGHKYGLERGDDIAMLPGEERRERVHKNKAVLKAERQAKDAITNAIVEKQQLEQQKAMLEGETQSIRQQKEELEGNISQLEDYAAALDIKEEDLIVPVQKTDPLVKTAWEAIKTELGMQMEKTKTSNQRQKTLLPGASLLKHSGVVLTQQMKSNAEWLLAIC